MNTVPAPSMGSVTPSPAPTPSAPSIAETLRALVGKKVLISMHHATFEGPLCVGKTGSGHDAFSVAVNFANPISEKHGWARTDFVAREVREVQGGSHPMICL